MVESLSILLVIIMLLYASVKIVPQQELWIVERFGKFRDILQPGLNFIIPIVDYVAYKHTLKEQTLEILPQKAISKDNVSLSIDGVLYVKIVDAKSASYGVQDPYYAISQLAQTTMRSEIGKLSLDKTFEERDSLNVAIVNAINSASESWGIQCLRYEIKDIHPPTTVLQAMELQVAAERKKRAEILESEGKRQAQINLAEAQKATSVLNSEGAYIDQINRAKGEAEAVEMVANATAKGINLVSQAIETNSGRDAASLRIAEQYISSFSLLAKESNTLIIPADLTNPASFIASSMKIYEKLGEKQVEENISDLSKKGPW